MRPGNYFVALGLNVGMVLSGVLVHRFCDALYHHVIFMEFSKFARKLHYSLLQIFPRQFFVVSPIYLHFSMMQPPATASLSKAA